MSKSKLIKNLVPKPEDNRSILRQIKDLNIPEAEKIKMLEDIIKKKYPDKGWQGLKYDWDVHRRVDQWFDIIPDKDWRTACWLAGRGYGKACIISTQIPTPSGWTTMGEISVGDKVFDENGNICNVTAVTDEYIPEKAYKLTFSDGAELTVCDEHQFVTWRHSDRKAYLRRDTYNHGEDSNKFPDDWVNWRKKVAKGSRKIDKDRIDLAKKLLKSGASNREIYKQTRIQGAALDNLRKENYSYFNEEITINEDIGPRVRTVKEIVNTFTFGKRNDTNHCIPLCRPIKTKDKDLPLSPYIYGLYLGDGCMYSGYISQQEKDFTFLKEEIEKEGFEIYSYNPKTTVIKIKGLRKKLSDLGILYEKKIIKDYLRGSVQQRIDLVCGLMDTDGHIHKENKTCEFVNTNKEIADYLFELLCSLGQKPVMTVKDAKLYGISKKPAYRITFNPTIQVFRLPRKAELLEITGSQMLRNHHRMIVKYEEVTPSKMKCIQVDSKNSMYLLGSHFIPSHNTRVAAEITRHLAENNIAKRIGVICPTAHDANAVFLAGNSGLLNVSPPWNAPIHHPTYKRVTWPNSDTELSLFSAEDPESLRGHQFDWLIMDELAAWTKGKAVWEQAILTLRLGKHPRAIVTTTPKANELIKAVVSNENTWVINGSTEENSDNIDVRQMVSMFEGTRLGRQELHGEILEDIEGALWSEKLIEETRINPKHTDELPDFLSVVIAVDPAMTANKNSDHTGICVAAYGLDDHYYILYADRHRESPHQWAKRVVDLYDYFMCDFVVVETNQGGDLVANNLKQFRPFMPIYGVHAKRSKALRAEPVAHAYELRRVHHVGMFPAAEEEMTMFNPVQNPNGKDDIVDSLVYAVTALMEKAMVHNVYKPALGGIRQKMVNFKIR